MNERESAPPTILLTGFEPFGGEASNPSWQAVRPLHGQVLRGHRVVTACLPTDFRRALPALRRELARHRPALSLCLGQAGGRSGIELERVAINLVDARIADNAGHRPIDVPVVRGGPAAYFATVPVKAMLARLQAAGVPAAVSHSAGTYVCNQVFYALMHALRGRPQARGGFVHIPYAPAQAARHAGAPSLDPALVTRALELMLDTALRTRRDRRLSAGTIA